MAKLSKNLNNTWLKSKLSSSVKDTSSETGVFSLTLVYHTSTYKSNCRPSIYSGFFLETMTPYWPTLISFNRMQQYVTLTTPKRKSNKWQQTVSTQHTVDCFTMYTRFCNFLLKWFCSISTLFFLFRQEQKGHHIHQNVFFLKKGILWVFSISNKCHCTFLQLHNMAIFFLMKLNSNSCFCVIVTELNHLCYYVVMKVNLTICYNINKTAAST